MNKIVITIVIIALVLLGIFWISNQDSQDVPSVTEGEDEEMMESEVKEFEVLGTEFDFSVPEMRVSVGDTVRVTFKNTGTMPHDFVIDEFNVATQILSPGEEETIEFTASQAGEFEYYCSVGTHREQGMFGRIIVE